MKRKDLPFRKNCEGYFISEDGKVLAIDTGGSFLGFPGGGIDEGESIEQGILRETREETGAIIKNLKNVKVIRFVWDEDWAKTEKQKKRYNYFQGEEMHLFVGEVDEFIEPEKKDEDYWECDKLMKISDAIRFIESTKPFSDDMKEYRKCQIRFLKLLGEFNFQKQF